MITVRGYKLRAAGALSRPELAAAFRRNRAFAGALAFLVVLLLLFSVLSPSVFLEWQTYAAVFVSLPLIMILAGPSVFIVTSGEIDLSFPSVVGIGALIFTESYTAGTGPVVALLLALAAGLAAGTVTGALVAYVGLSSLVVTLGLLFLLRGVVQIVSNGIGTPLVELEGGTFTNVLVGQYHGFPVQMAWALGLTLVAVMLFNWHRFGAHVKAVGDNALAAREMGIAVSLVKLATFAYIGVMAAFVGVLSVLINLNFWPTAGDGLLLVVLAAVFLGGTPTWGGVGTVAGGAAGAATVAFIEPGIIAVGLTGFYTQFVYGLVIVASLLTHKIAGTRAGER